MAELSTTTKTDKVRMPLVSPSLLSADFANLCPALEMIDRSEADWLHCDVMDGLFVPNISFGFPVIKAVGRVCHKPLDVHFMIERPERYVAEAAAAGAWMMTVHQEATVHLDRLIHQIHDAGMRAGVALNPSTPVATLEDVIGDVDMVLLMSVNPGFGGQRFIPNTYHKIARLRQLMDSCGVSKLIEVDGGVNGETAPRLVEAGADVLVSGSYVFRAADPEAVIASLKRG